MTATLTDRAKASVTTQEKTPFDKAVEAIIDETRAEASLVKGFVQSMGDNLANLARTGDARWFMSTKWLNRYHGLLEAIAPDDTRSTEGSAFAALEAAVLNPTAGQLGLVHTSHERTYSGRSGRLHCTVDVTIDVVRI